MVVLNKIYTRTGDDGTTALGTGARIAKNHQRVIAYGTVDETNAALGLARALLQHPAPTPAANTLETTHRDGHAIASLLDGILANVQNDLFDLGADLCVPETGRNPDQKPDQKTDNQRLRLSTNQISRLEGNIDRLNETLAPLRSFVLPGGTPPAAALHMARTICRRAEREVVTLAADTTEPVSAHAITYLNRLSDLLFVASRYLNHQAGGDVLWQPGRNI